ncbi:MAG: MarR family transcriptional regulator [Oscillospiraceae bacterium]|nr:MarR family transcriptional regulator [Oscillospiraceae bacterium]
MYEQLKLENQLCFPLYACAKEIVRRYKPFLDPLDLTYTQYIAMMVLWEREQVSVKELGECLWLDSGTLTPVLKKLEAKGYIVRSRSETDERTVLLTVTPKGWDLRTRAADVPAQVGSGVHLTVEEAGALHALLHKMLAGMK